MSSRHTDNDGDQAIVIGRHLCLYATDGEAVSVNLTEIEDPFRLALEILRAVGSHTPLINGAVRDELARTADELSEEEEVLMLVLRRKPGDTLLHGHAAGLQRARGIVMRRLDEQSQ